MMRSNYARNMGSGLGGLLFGFMAGALTWAFFGKRIKRAMEENRNFQDMKSEVEARYFQAKNFSQEAYNKIVDEVSDKYSKARGISKNELRDLADDLKMHWKRIKTAWNKSEKDDDPGMNDMTESF